MGRLASALEDETYLLGADYSAVDLLLSSPFQAMSDALPQEPSVRAWIERCATRPAVMAAAGRRAA
jgi:glutathione S-transferase